MRTQVLELVETRPGQTAQRRAQSRANQAAPFPGQEKPPAASPSNILDKELVDQPQPATPAQVGEAGRMTSQEAAGLAKVLVPEVYLQNDTEGYGYPKGSRVYKINMQQAWALAILNARFYQYNLEPVYLAALPVTLQRFAFEPQFYAAWARSQACRRTAVASGGSFPSTPGVVSTPGLGYNYATRYGPNGQISALNIGTVAGFGKLFSSGGQLLMGFANEVAFNFLNKNPSAADGDLGVADQLRAATLARRRPGRDPRAADPGRAESAVRDPYVHAVPPAVLRRHLDRRKYPELR